jgi:septum formation protein
MLILASNSPRRKQLMALGGWNFEVIAVPVDESVQPGELPQDYVRRLAESKACAALDVLDAALRSQALVIAADTAVVDVSDSPSQQSNAPSGETDGAAFEIFGKPRDAAHAEVMLRRLRGRTHQVMTGLAVLKASDACLRSEVVITDVPMRGYTDREMQAYIVSGDPLDKAGAYAIQHAGFHPVQNLQGCYANVMGLPVCHLSRMLAGFGVLPLQDAAHDCQAALEYPCPLSEKLQMMQE